MPHRDLLKRLEELFLQPEVTKGFRSRENCIEWANRVAPLLKFVDQQYYMNFMVNSHKLNLDVSSYTIVPAWNIMRSQVQMAIEELRLRVEMEEPSEDQIYFPEGRHLDIQKRIGSILRRATKALWIYDPYMDEKIVEEVGEVPAGEIRFLTENPKSLFHQRLTALKQQCAGKQIEVRGCGVSHDRFLVVDGEEVWTLGASYNQAGKKATVLTKITAEEERRKIIEEFERWWKGAKPI